MQRLLKSLHGFAPSKEGMDYALERETERHGGLAAYGGGVVGLIRLRVTTSL